MMKKHFNLIGAVLLSLLLVSCGQKNGRSLGDIDFSTNQTEQQVKAVWGAPDAFAGEDNQYQVYLVKDEETWLEYGTNPPYPVISVFGMPGIGVTVSPKRNRDIQDLDFSKPLTYRQIASIWGRPDDFTGSGISYLVYFLDGGKCATMRFETKKLILTYISLFDPKTRHSKSIPVPPPGYVLEPDRQPLSLPEILVLLVPLFVVVIVSISQSHPRKLLIRLLRRVMAKARREQHILFM